MLRHHILPLDHPIQLQIDLLAFEGWTDPSRFIQEIYIHPIHLKSFIFTDNSHYGWDTHNEPMRLFFNDRWTEDQSQLHINILEIMAIRFALKGHTLHPTLVS